MAFLLQCRRHDLYLDRNMDVKDQAQEAFRELVERRAAGEPVQYILGSQHFMGLDFSVDKRVLIPRGDTEVLVEHVYKQAVRSDGPVRILEIGTGSGAIAISLAVLLPQACITSIDIDSDALEVAQINALKHQVTDRVTFLQGDMFTPLMKDKVQRNFDALISNPPYIPAADIEGLECQVKDYEPRTALNGGKDGLDFYRGLAREALGFLKMGALWAVEVGHDQAFDVANLLKEQGGYHDIDFIKDLAGIDRVVTARVI